MRFEVLNTFPELAQRQTVTLGGKTVEILFQWIPRLEGWYADIYDDETGEALLRRRRLNVDVDLFDGSLDLPGFLVPTGDPNGEFGTDFIVMWISDE